MENNCKYFVVKPIVNGFETVMIMYGEESDIRNYIKYVMDIPCSYNIINEQFARNLFDIGFKVYMCPSSDMIQSTTENED